MARILIIGCGSIASAVFSALLDRGHELWVVTKSDAISARYASLFEAKGVPVEFRALVPENYEEVLGGYYALGIDLVLNLSVEVSSKAVLSWCGERGIHYMDTCVEPWAEGYDRDVMPEYKTTNAWLRSDILGVELTQSVGVVACGANPGLVSLFVKQALVDMAYHRGIAVGDSFAGLAEELGVRVVHVSERDTQWAEGLDGVVDNTWSIPGLMSEANQYGELGVGDVDRGFSGLKDLGQGISVLNKASREWMVKSWVPSYGVQEGYLITHHEALSIQDYLATSTYSPSSYYVYRPIQSMFDYLGKGGECRGRVIREEIVGGFDELGVYLMADWGAWWCGSTLSIGEARRCMANNNATSLQVVSMLLVVLESILRGEQGVGVKEAEDLVGWEVLLEGCLPYLGEYKSMKAPLVGEPCLANLLVR